VRELTSASALLFLSLRLISIIYVSNLRRFAGRLRLSPATSGAGDKRDADTDGADDVQLIAEYPAPPSAAADAEQHTGQNK
jgi:hypothetical protein